MQNRDLFEDFVTGCLLLLAGACVLVGLVGLASIVIEAVSNMIGEVL